MVAHLAKSDFLGSILLKITRYERDLILKQSYTCVLFNFFPYFFDVEFAGSSVRTWVLKSQEKLGAHEPSKSNAQLDQTTCWPHLSTRNNDISVLRKSCPSERTSNSSIN